MGYDYIVCFENSNVGWYVCVCMRVYAGGWGENRE